MKVQYCGHKKLTTVRLPVGLRRKSQKETVDFTAGEIKEIPDADALKLIELNKAHGTFKAASESLDEAPAGELEPPSEDDGEKKPRGRKRSK